MNIQPKSPWEKSVSSPLNPKAFKTPLLSQSVSANPLNFGNKFADEIKDTKGLVKEKGKGIGIFSYIFSQGTFPLKLISSVSLELDPEKREKIKAYNELVKVGLRPSSHGLEVELKGLAERAASLVERKNGSSELVTWMNTGVYQLNSMRAEKGFTEVDDSALAGRPAPMTMTLAATENWVKQGEALLEGLKNPSSPALGVLAKDTKRFIGLLNNWLATEKQAQATLSKPSEKLQAWMKSLNITHGNLERPVLDANTIDREAYVPSQVLTRMKDLGLFKLKVPSEYGGLDLHQKEYHRVIREIPKLSGTLGALVSAHSTIGSAPLVLNGTKAQQEEYLPKIAEGNYLAAFGLTEPGAGTDTKKLKTTATLSPDGKEWIINGESGEFGEKLYITNTHRSGVMFLMTKTDLGEHFGTPGDNAMIAKWLHTQVKSKKNPKGTLNEFGDPVGTKYEGATPWVLDPKDRSGKATNFDYIRAKHPDRPWKSLSNKMLKESVIIVDLPFRITDTPDQRKEKMKDMADKGMVIADPLDLMMIRGSNQAFIRFNNFRVPVNKVLGGVGEDVEPLLKTLKENATRPAVPGLDWRKMTLNGKPLKLDGAGQGMTDVFNALNRGRAGFGPSYSGAVRAMLEESRRHAVQREMFDLYGGTQDKMPVIKKYLGEMAMKSAALDAVSELTSALIEERGDKMNIIDVSAAIKVISTEWNWDSAQLAMRILGGAGTKRGADNGMERNFRDAWIGLIVEGVNEAMKQVVVGVGATPALESKDALLGTLFSFKSYKTPIKSAKLVAGEFGKLTRGMVPGFMSEKGDLDRADARWIQSRSKQLWRKSSVWGARQGTNMMGRQNELIRLSDIALDLYSLAAVHLKLKKAQDLPTEERTSLQEFINVTKRRIDKNLK
ncbi:MAG: acyl-CoA dehydrogenase family protein, partial [Cyanobacteria bacterium]|nr:acyl-CoA dehydrogenase family protein [Cyanobacteriota bacterium]